MNQYSTRQYIIAGIFLSVFFIFLIRLFYIQIIDSTYKYSAENNSQRYVINYPARGLIYDRHHKLLVSNKAAYDLMVNPQELREFDTASFCKILNINKEYVDKTLKKIKDYSRYKSSPFLFQVSDTTYAELQEKLYLFPGFYVQARTLRQYQHPIAAHLFGYVGEVDSSIIKKNDYYQMGDYIGMSGLEKSYEEQLRGVKGVNILLVDVHNRVKGSLQNGKLDRPAILGKNLVSSIDADLQMYGEKLIKNFRGSIVAIDPQNGEILAIVSNPTYDPSLLVGRERTKKFVDLRNDKSNPLFYRAIMSKNPPGSTFKLLNAMISLQTGVATPATTIACHRGYTCGAVHVNCHVHQSPLDMSHSIQHSCNAYYSVLFRKIIDDQPLPRNQAYDVWRKLIMSFGLGQKLHSDLANELGGNIPSSKYYDKIYRKSWNSLTVVSLGIGQGEVGLTPLQMANVACAIANRGYYYVPHVIKQIEGIDTIDHRFTQKNYTLIKPEYFQTAIDGMYMAVNGPGGGTATGAAVKGLDICGKTGTAQNPHGEDHSTFIAFAPKDNPKIAISVYIENGGFGATIAVPIASLLIEKYLTDSITRPNYEQYLETKKINYPAK